MREYDYLVVGAGIIGLSIAKSLKEKYPASSVGVIEKESTVAKHSSGRNSGVLHAGFYYTADSLKAKFTKEGNQALRNFCEENKLHINKCGKIVVAQTQKEIEGLEELKRRAEANKVELEWIEEDELEKFSLCAKTYKKALLSPTTSTVEPEQVCQTLLHHVEKMGVIVHFDTKYKYLAVDGVISTSKGLFGYGKLINAAGLYADKVAKHFGFGEKYTIIPFKGIYLKDTANSGNLKTNIYPVPNLKNPFLGVHYTYSVHKEAKIGPTAIPAFWRENYKSLENFDIKELYQIAYWEAKLFVKNAFGFRSLAIEEMKKYNKKYFLDLAKKLTKNMQHNGFTTWSKPGIRAQLLDKKTLELVQDFVVEGDRRSIHVLNAVSPAFTCSMPFADWVVENYVHEEKKEVSS